MSFATTIGHTFTGVLPHHAHIHLPRHRSAAPTPALAPTPERPRRVRSAAAIDAAVADHRQDLEQWRAAFTFGIGLNR